jgi:translocation and assembly module TamB
LHTSFDQLSLQSDPLTSANNIVLDMDYRYKDDYLNFKTDYLLVRDGQQMQTHQELRYTLEGVTTSTFNGEIITEAPLSSKSVLGEFRDDSQGISGKLSLENSILLLKSSDYANFKWDLKSVQKDLNRLDFLPVALRESSLLVSANGSYTIETNQLDGTFSAKHTYGDTNGSIHYENEAFHLDVHGKKGIFSLTYANKKLLGSGDLLGTQVQLNGFYDNEGSDLTITTSTPSLLKTLSQLDSIKLPKGEYYDAQVQTATHIYYDTTLHISTEINVPWYAAVIDSQRQYGGTNNTVFARYSDNTIFIDNYRLDIAGHDVNSQRLSKAHISNSGNLLIDELWIFDALRLNGEINTDTLATELALHSDKFTYKGPEGEAHAAMDLLFTRNEHAIQTLSGNVEILNANITYLPLQKFKVMDNDVIIVQDVRPPSDTSLFVNVQITSKEPLHYHTKELDVFVQPELTVWKEPTGNIQLLGMVTIPQGTATTSGKEFTIQPSHLYFAGGDAINPYLDFTIGHEVDYKKIKIYITHKLDSPIFLFSSDPFMSQNDIMSYLLFGSPADASLNTDGSKTAVKTDATNFMLGAGVKGLINNTTKIQIDTMNILTTQEGGMGIEVGTHLNKDLRVLYKNDTVSSVLVQYQLNRWLRLDADIHELGQGINAIYIKDFRDFLPHNSAVK